MSNRAAVILWVFMGIFVGVPAPLGDHRMDVS
jgi:hypothetical protein